MESQTLKSRLSILRQKSRKAFGLYRKMGRSGTGENARLSELQMNEWKSINADLCSKLGECIEEQNMKRVSALVFSVRDYFLGLWRSAQSALHLRQKDLIGAAEQGDFVKAAILSHDLVSVRAREQACQAAYSELQSILSGKTDQRAELQSSYAHSSDSAMEGEAPKVAAASRGARVFQLRRAR